MIQKLNKKILVFQQFIHMNITKDGILIYNANNGQKIILKSKVIYGFLTNNKQYNFFYIKESDLKSKVISSFINDCVSKGFGLILETRVEPVVFDAQINNIDYNNIRGIASQINAITINFEYENNDFVQTFSTFIQPIVRFNKFVNIIFNIFNLEHEIIARKIRKIFIENSNIQFTFSYNYDLLENNKIFNLYTKEHNINKIIVIKRIKNVNFKILSEIPKEKNVLINFLIKSIDDYTFVVKNISLNNIVHSFSPYYDNNISFFKEYVFLKEEDILSLKPTNSEIIKNKILNTNFFGKLTIFTNGSVFSNIHSKEIGNIYQNSVFDVIKNEIGHENGWFVTRQSKEPCNQCIYNILCPPISKYEYLLNQYNLCEINK